MNQSQDSKEQQNRVPDNIEKSTIGELIDPNNSPPSTAVLSELDTFLQEISEASALFFQNLQVKIQSSDAADGDSESDDGKIAQEIPVWSNVVSDFPAQHESEDVVSPNFIFNDDDDMDNEWRRLGAAEENLRKELDLASCGFGLLGCFQKKTKENLNSTSFATMGSHEMQLPGHSLHEGGINSRSKSLLDDDSRNSEEHGARSHFKGKGRDPKTYIQDADNYNPVGSYVSAHEMSQQRSTNLGTDSLHTSASEKACYIGLHRLPCDLGAFSCPIFRPNPAECTVYRRHFYREFVSRMPSSALRKLFVGLEDFTRKDCKASHAFENGEIERNNIKYAIADDIVDEESVRTISIQIRPDILCGSIMDAIDHIVLKLEGEILKRQGAHIQAIFPPAYKAMKDLSFRGSSFAGSCAAVKDEMRLLPPWVMDAHVCTRKRSRDCERILLIRVLHVSPSLQAEIPLTPPSCESDIEKYIIDDCDLMLENSASCLWDAARILHDMIMDRGIEDESNEIWRSWEPKPSQHKGRTEEYVSPSKPSSASKVARKIGQILVSPIIQMGGRSNMQHNVARALSDQFPSLSHYDAPVVESAWNFIRNCVCELESRDFTYGSLATRSFGAFPALSTIDSNYCSQLQLLVRESMVLTLLKTAAELERFVRDAEHSCANLIQLLNPAFIAYGIDPPELPCAVPLSAYPLDFTPSDIAFPPWGQNVMEALSVTSSSSTSECSPSSNGFTQAREAVCSVLTAFQVQADEEQSARLSRKNMQVMDRLAKMQELKRASIRAVCCSFDKSSAAVKAATEFCAKANTAVSSYKSAGRRFQTSDQVPLFQCGIFLGGATGTCFLTAHQLLCVTQLVPIVGVNRYHLFDVKDIELAIAKHPPNTLMQLPPGLIIRKNSESSLGTSEEEILRFVPSIDAQRFKDLFDTIRDNETGPQDSIKFYSVGECLYID